MPQKCDVQMMPKKVMDTKRPFSSRDKFKSHWAAGIMNDMFIDSIITHIKHPPAAKITNKLYFPYPETMIIKLCYSSYYYIPVRVTASLYNLVSFALFTSKPFLSNVMFYCG